MALNSIFQCSSYNFHIGSFRYYYIWMSLIAVMLSILHYFPLGPLPFHYKYYFLEYHIYVSIFIDSQHIIIIKFKRRKKEYCMYLIFSPSLSSSWAFQILPFLSVWKTSLRYFLREDIPALSSFCLPSYEEVYLLPWSIGLCFYWT